MKSAGQLGQLKAEGRPEILLRESPASWTPCGVCACLSRRPSKRAAWRSGQPSRQVPQRRQGRPRPQPSRMPQFRSTWHRHFDCDPSRPCSGGVRRAARITVSGRALCPSVRSPSNRNPGGRGAGCRASAVNRLVPRACTMWSIDACEPGGGVGGSVRAELSTRQHTHAVFRCSHATCIRAARRRCGPGSARLTCTAAACAGLGWTRRSKGAHPWAR